MDALVPLVVVGILFLGLPWIIFHYITKWKQAATLTREDENLLDELHDMARRLDDRMTSIERIIAADHPDTSIRSDPGLKSDLGLKSDPGARPRH